MCESSSSENESDNDGSGSEADGDAESGADPAASGDGDGGTYADLVERQAVHRKVAGSAAANVDSSSASDSEGLSRQRRFEGFGWWQELVWRAHWRLRAQKALALQARCLATAAGKLAAQRNEHAARVQGVMARAAAAAAVAALGRGAHAALAHATLSDLAHAARDDSTAALHACAPSCATIVAYGWFGPFGRM